MADPANECFALRREDGSLTGEIKLRALVHRDGDLHGASHVFLARLRGERAELLLQKRSAQKDSFPGLYDISAAGHLDPGEDFAAAARRELAEELGVTGRSRNSCLPSATNITAPSMESRSMTMRSQGSISSSSTGRRRRLRRRPVRSSPCTGFPCGRSCAPCGKTTRASACARRSSAVCCRIWHKSSAFRLTSSEAEGTIKVNRL